MSTVSQSQVLAHVRQHLRSIRSTTLSQDTLQSSLRSIISHLLSQKNQRIVFLEYLTSARGASAGLRALFGAPPYTFLNASDCVSLSASGVAGTRANIGYDTPLIDEVRFPTATGGFVPQYTTEDGAVKARYESDVDNAPTLAVLAQHRVLTLGLKSSKPVTVNQRLALQHTPLFLKSMRDVGAGSSIKRLLVRVVQITSISNSAVVVVARVVVLSFS